ncbi:hypothetical protein [Kutzneria sp. CA-103260]|uniref:hypothetical protein n=1 Tax=Kutzneria sp. CA-103260 TaxID=2802641 RepID=UPI001BA6D8B9|nr:hypothetical protein [Kutzneria sp. CA-103260]
MPQLGDLAVVADHSPTQARYLRLQDLDAPDRFHQLALAFELFPEMRVRGVQRAPTDLSDPRQRSDVALAAERQVTGQQRRHGRADPLLGLTPLFLRDPHVWLPPVRSKGSCRFERTGGATRIG